MILIPIISGKGGVGKTSLCIGIALALKALDRKSAMLDLDLENPSLGTVCGLNRDDLKFEGDYIVPPRWHDIPVMSLSLLPLADFIDTPTMVDEERKHELIYHLATEVNWEDSDIIIVDMPPGSGEEVRGLLKFPLASSILVTSPQEISEAAVRRVVVMAQEYVMPILGIVENNVNKAAGGEAGKNIAEQYNIPFLGKIPWSLKIVQGMEAHEPFHHAVFTAIAKAIIEINPIEGDQSVNSIRDRSETMVRDGVPASEQAGVTAGSTAEVSGVSSPSGGDDNSPAPA